MVAAVADEAGLAGVPRLLQDGDHVPLAQLFLAARVELDQVHPVRPQALEAAVNGLFQQLRVPVGQVKPRGVARLGEQWKSCLHCKIRRLHLGHRKKLTFERACPLRLMHREGLFFGNAINTTSSCQPISRSSNECCPSIRGASILI